MVISTNAITIVMLINKQWRVLTIGDGDLSFSASVAKHVAPKQLVATVFDQKSVLVDKYTSQHLDKLTEADITVLTGFDVTDATTWQNLPTNSFDLVIFQFPLVPNNVTYQQHQASNSLGSSNTINRWLLHRFLAHSFDKFLAKDGARLAMITSKDVKPYRQWAIETSIVQNLDCQYVGQCDFDFNNYPDYHIRNVDRDKFVKDTLAISYFYSDITQPSLSKQLSMPTYCLSADYCALCRVGPIETAQDLLAHQQSKRHRQMSDFETQWQRRLGRVN